MGRTPVLESSDFMEKQSKRTKIQTLDAGFRRAINGSVLVTCVVAMIVLCIMMILVPSDVVLRYVFNAPSPWIHEILTFLLVVLVFFGIAYTQREGAHIRVDFLFTKLPKVARVWVELITLFIFFVYAVILLYYTSTCWLTSWKHGTTSPTSMQFHLAPWHASIPLGLAILALLLVRTIFVKAIEVRRRKTD